MNVHRHRVYLLEEHENTNEVVLSSDYDALAARLADTEAQLKRESALLTEAKRQNADLMAIIDKRDEALGFIPLDKGMDMQDELREVKARLAEALVVLKTMLIADMTRDRDLWIKTWARVPALTAGVSVSAYDEHVLRSAYDAQSRNRLESEIERLRNAIDCACNALTDSVQVSGNDAVTNMQWVHKLRAALAADQPSSSADAAQCATCKGTGAVDTPTSEADPVCSVCDGEGTVWTSPPDPQDAVEIPCRECKPDAFSCWRCRDTGYTRNAWANRKEACPDCWSDNT